MLRSSLLAALLLVGISTTLAAQQPTSEQRAAVRAACRDDFVANCSGVQPGTREALACLASNEAKLSPACGAAVGAITGKSAAPSQAAPAATNAPATAPGAPSSPAPHKSAMPPERASPQAPPKAAAQGPTQDQLSAVRQACTLNDMLAHCSWIKPDSPEILLCLQGNAAELSPSCRAAVGSAQAAPASPAAQAQPAENAQPADTAPAAPPPHRRPGVKPHVGAAPRRPRLQTKRNSPVPSRSAPSVPRADLILRGTVGACSREARKRCNVCSRMARSSRGRAAAPSRRSVAGLLLQEANSAMPGGAPPGAEAQPGETGQPGDTAPPPRKRPGVTPRVGAAPPSAPPPSEAQKPSPEQISAVRAACRSDFMAHCRGVQPGGAEALQCLQQNGPQLSGPCRGAVAAIGGGAPPAGNKSAAPGAAPPGAPGPGSVRGRRLDRCRCCAPARHSTSCGSAARIGADCVVTFRRAGAGSLLASRKTPRTCHLIVPRRSPPHAGSVEIVFQKPAIPVIAAMRLQLAHRDGVSAAPRIV